MHGLPVQVTVALGDLASLDADPDLDCMMRIGGASPSRVGATFAEDRLGRVLHT